jgi:hypothetical protein
MTSIRPVGVPLDPCITKNTRGLQRRFASGRLADSDFAFAVVATRDLGKVVIGGWPDSADVDKSPIRLTLLRDPKVRIPHATPEGESPTNSALTRSAHFRQASVGKFGLRERLLRLLRAVGSSVV